MKEKRVFHKRAFLNSGEGMAALEVRVIDGSYTVKDTGKCQVNLDGGLSVTDCSRAISLDFYVWDAKSLAAAVQKADTLIDAIEGMRDALVKAAKREGIRRG
jgi:hypothetical protein